MVNKNKKTTTITENINAIAMQGGLVLMAAATTLGMVELPEHLNKSIVLNQPAFAMASNSSEAEQSSPIRRERDETAPHYTSYNIMQRTPGRTGKI